ncbi:MAG: ParA family protein [Gammaproteobacteria bacterium]|nr:MAG: ParA family protein [Gammaproteobacteria bacterium]
MQIFAVANQKGGVGKTTTAVTVGGILAAKGVRVVLVDMDPHGSLTCYFKLNPETVEDSLYTLFQGAANGRAVDVSALLRPTPVEGLSFIPAVPGLAALDRQLGMREGMGLVLKRSLAGLQFHCDVVILDCLPVLGILLVNALAACEQLVIPVQTEFLAIKGLERMMHTISMIDRSLRQTTSYTIVPTLYDQRTRASVETLEQIRATHLYRVWSGVIPVDTQFREASKHGLPVSHYAPHARGSVAYGKLTEHLYYLDTQPESAAQGM